MATTQQAANSKKGQGFQGVRGAFWIIVVCAAIAFTLFYTWFANPMHFQGGNLDGHPADVWGTIFKGGFIVPVIHSLLLTVLAMTIERVLAMKTAFGTGSLPKFVLNIKAALNANDFDKARQLCLTWGLKIITIKDLIAYRLKKESTIEVGEEVDLPTIYGHFRLVPFRQKSNGAEHMAIIKGEWKPGDAVLVRVHSSCATGDILGSKRCDCGEQLHKSLEMIEQEGQGVVIYMQQEGRGIGLMNKMAAYKLQEQGYDTVDANVHLGFKPDERDYGCGAQMLRHLGVSKMRLLTNNPTKRVGLEAYGLEIVENIPIEITPNPYDRKYLETKRDRMGHELHIKI